MNLLQFQNNYFIDNNKDITIENFRQYQYDNIKLYCEDIVKYITKHDNTLFKFHSVDIKNNINYLGITNSKTQDISINIELPDGTINKFLSFFMPSLIENNHFFINGNYYTPIIYCIDMPIVIKKESIKLWSLFNSITFNPKRATAIFCMNNIPIDYILSMFLLYNSNNEELYNNYLEKYKLKSNNLEELEIIQYFNNLFKKHHSDLNSIINTLESIFFDDYTKELYELQYSDCLEDINLTNVVTKAIYDDVNDIRFNFIDLSNKRLIFMELLFKPIYQKLSNFIINIIRGKLRNFTELTFNESTIVKYFLSAPASKDNPSKGSGGLSGNYLYDTANLYSSVLNHRMNFTMPGVLNPPKEVQGMHESHFKKLCPCTISSIDPGRTISIVYGTKLDKFGRFI